MKDIKLYIIESNKEHQFEIKYAANNFAENIKKAENDGWKLDNNYNNWSAGEFVTVKLTRNKEILWIEANDKNGLYKGDNPEVFNKLKIDHYEYKNI